MFMTLRYGRDGGDGIRHLEQTGRSLRSGDNLSHSVCISCRSKKVGCFLSSLSLSVLVWVAH